VRGKKLVWASLATLLVLSAVLAMPTPVRASPDATVYIDPPSVTGLDFGQTFTVNLKISDAFGVYAWSKRITWDPGILEYVSATEGSFLKSKITTFFVKKPFQSQGYLDLACTAVGSFNGAFGAGTLASITFRALDVGVTDIGVPIGLLIDQLLNELPHTEVGGSADCHSELLTPDRYVELVEKKVDNRHWEINIKGTVFTFYGKGKNRAPDMDLWCRIVFSGMKDAEPFTAITDSILLAPGQNSPPFQTYTLNLDPTVDIGTYTLEVHAEYSFMGYKWYTSPLGKTMDLSFVILP